MWKHMHGKEMQSKNNTTVYITPPYPPPAKHNFPFQTQRVVLQKK